MKMHHFPALAGLFCAVVAPPLRAAEEVIWNVKAVHPEGRLLDVKAIDAAGKIHPAKAIESDGNHHLLDIKALSAEVRTYDIKGIHLATTLEEGKINGVDFAAHVKALPQVP